MVFALQILIKTYIFQRADEALFIVNSKLRTLLVSIPTGDIVLKGSEPGFWETNSQVLRITDISTISQAAMLTQ